MNVYFRLFGYEVARIEVDLSPVVRLLGQPDAAGSRPADRIVKRFSKAWTSRMTS